MISSFWIALVVGLFAGCVLGFFAGAAFVLELFDEGDEGDDGGGPEAPEPHADVPVTWRSDTRPPPQQRMPN